MPSFTWRRVDAGYELLTGDEWAPAPDDFQPPAGSDGPGPFHTMTLDTKVGVATMDADGTLTDTDARTWIGTPPEPPDIRTWDGLAEIIDQDESWSTGDNTVEKMKAAGWRPPPALDPANCGNGGPGHNFSVCIHCGIEEADYLQILDDVEREHDQP